MDYPQTRACYCCGGGQLEPVFRYTAPPPGETLFSFSTNGNYRREVVTCRCCGHFMSHCDMSLAELYSGNYMNSTYGDGLRRTFERITSLPPERSDNTGRCQRLIQFADSYLTALIGEGRAPTILDIGSGLCVFLHRMKAAGWSCTALDPDPRAVTHAHSVVGVQGICGDFFALDDLGLFDVIALNKVLEHVADPVKMLARTQRFLLPGGFVYVEVPDGEVAARHGPNREEFFVEHLHVFSAASLSLLAREAGFTVLCAERLQEPSTKFTLRAFLGTGA